MIFQDDYGLKKKKKKNLGKKLILDNARLIRKTIVYKYQTKIKQKIQTCIKPNL